MYAFLFTVSYDLVNKLNDLQVDIMRKINRLDHLVFFDLIGTCLNHNDFFAGRGDCQVQV